jgi:hypothetical protein
MTSRSPSSLQGGLHRGRTLKAGMTRMMICEPRSLAALPMKRMGAANETVAHQLTQAAPNPALASGRQP